jgi:pimeloyl-ACP methyl ester carboxylesterase/DNA-binding CsgD family transcriptional regulator
VVLGEPTVRYARCGEVHIAYQVLGRGPCLVIVPGFMSHLELQWEDPAFRSFVRRLARFCTVVRFDKRGTGLSDPVTDLPTLEERQADLAAVLEEAGVERPVLLGFSEGGPIALRFATSAGTQLAGLVLYGTSAHAPPPWAMEEMRAAAAAWGSGATIEMFCASLAGDPVARSARGRYERESASPAMAKALVEGLLLIDCTEVLPRVTQPTLVLHRRQDVIPLEEAAYLASQIATARLVELEGIDHVPWLGDSQVVINEIEQFIASLFPDRSNQAGLVESGATRRGRPSSGWASLTPRENDVAAMIAEGCSNPVIGQRLYISRQTVETHLKHIFAKLGVDSRTALAGIARERATAIRNT